jgi:hypothetical protein
MVARGVIGLLSIKYFRYCKVVALAKSSKPSANGMRSALDTSEIKVYLGNAGAHRRKSAAVP